MNLLYVSILNWDANSKTAKKLKEEGWNYYITFEALRQIAEFEVG
jgi:hypothetical protein